MHDQVLFAGRHRLTWGHVLHRHEEEVATEDLPVAGERLAAVAAEVQVRMKGHGYLLLGGRTKNVPSVSADQSSGRGGPARSLDLMRRSQCDRRQSRVQPSWARAEVRHVVEHP